MSAHWMDDTKWIVVCGNNIYQPSIYQAVVVTILVTRRTTPFPFEDKIFSMNPLKFILFQVSRGEDATLNQLGNKNWILVLYNSSGRIQKVAREH